MDDTQLMMTCNSPHVRTLSVPTNHHVIQEQPSSTPLSDSHAVHDPLEREQPQPTSSTLLAGRDWMRLGSRHREDARTRCNYRSTPPLIPFY